MEEREIENFREEIEKTTEQIENFQGALKVFGPNLLKLADPTGKLSEEFVKATQTSRNRVRAEIENITATTKQTQAASENIYVTEALTEAQEELEGSTKKLKAATGTLAQGTLDVASKIFDAAVNTEQNLGKYGAAITTAGDAAYDVAKQFGILGTIVGGVVKIFSRVADAQVKLIQDSLTAADSLGEFGANAGITNRELLRMGEGAGLTATQLPAFLKQVKNVGIGLQTLSSDTEKGTRALFDLITVTPKVRNEFRNLGISQEKLAESQLDYINLQKLSGRTFSEQYITSGQLKKSSLEYVLNLQELSRITGKDIESVKRDQEIANSTAQMAVYNFDQARKRGQLQQQMDAASAAGRTEEAEAIKKQIAAIENQQDAMRKANDAMVALQMPEAAGALQQFLVYGSASGEAATRFINLGIDVEKYRKQFQQGTFDANEFTAEYQKKFGERFDNLSRTLGNSGEAIEQMIKDLGLGSKEQIAFMAALQPELDKGLSIGDAFKAAEEKIRKATETPDDLEAARNKTLEAEIEARTKLQQQLTENLDPVLAALPRMAEAAAKVTENLELLGITLASIAGIAVLGKLVQGASKIYSFAARLGSFMRGTPPVGTPPIVPPAGPAGPAGGAGPIRNQAGELIGKDGRPLRGAALRSAEAKIAKEAASATTGAVDDAAVAASKTVADSAKGMLGTAQKVLGKIAIPASVLFSAYQGYTGYKEAEEKEAKGEITGQQAGAEKGRAVGGAGGALAAGLAGAGIGQALIPIPIVGAVVGGLLGGFLGDKIGGVIGEKIGESVSTDKPKTQPKNIDAIEKETQRQKELADKAMEEIHDSITPFASSLKLGTTDVKAFSEEIKNANELLSSLPAASDIGFTTSALRAGQEFAGMPSRDAVIAQQHQQQSLLGNIASIFKKAVGMSAMPGMGGMGPSMGGMFPDVSMPHGHQEPEAHGAMGGGETRTIPTLANVKSKSGKTTQVNAEHAARFQKLIDYLDGVGYEITSLGGYVNRDVRGKPGVKSVHAMGGAIDINPSQNPMGSMLVTDFPKEIQHVAKSLGLGWGGAWRNIKDAMHFSVARHEGGIGLSDGGIAVGSEEGYPATLHGTEIVVPLNPNSILAELGKKSVEQAYSSIRDRTENTIVSTNDNVNEMLRSHRMLIELLSNKLDTVIHKLDTGNETQSKILKYSQA